MSLRPASSRSQLKWNQFTQKDDGTWILVLPPYYAGLFEAYFPTLMKLSKRGFRDSKSAKTRLAFFPSLDDRAVERIEGFLTFFARAVCLTTNRHLKSCFSDELDFCLALDFNKPSPAAGRTEIGQWEYQAKYQHDKEALAELAARLVEVVVHSLPLSKIPKPRLLTFVPSAAGQDYCLPAEFVKRIIEIAQASFWGVQDPLVTPRLTIAKESAKSLTVDQKILQWDNIVKANGIRLSRSVKESSVIIVDDLYQSGASLWSFAKYLKSQGAAKTVGLACVKSLRDTDNR